MSFSDTALARLDAASPARRAAWDSFLALGLPTTRDEVWRYAPLTDFDLEAYDLAESDSSSVSTLVARLAQTAGHVVTTVNGRLLSSEGDVAVEVVADDLEWSAEFAGDPFAQLACALRPSTITIRVADGVDVAEPIVLAHSFASGASFLQVHLELGRGARATVVEVLEGGARSLVVPLSRYDVADGAQLTLATYQRLDASAWHVSRSQAHVGRDAHLRQSVISVGAHYNRARNDADFWGSGASNELRTTFLGFGDQVHDFRTRQSHRVGRTTSTLLSKGAVADEARSIYTGLIEIEKGAKRTDARQTNHNLLLSGHAHADSVPNLDIRENDVVCAHASSVGPLDELQRWYLESRGVPRPAAERLMIQGFLFEMLDTLPRELAASVEDDLATSLGRLEEAVA